MQFFILSASEYRNRLTYNHMFSNTLFSCLSYEIKQHVSHIKQNSPALATTCKKCMSIKWCARRTISRSYRNKKNTLCLNIYIFIGYIIETSSRFGKTSSNNCYGKQYHTANTFNILCIAHCTLEILSNLKLYFYVPILSSLLFYTLCLC